MRSETFRLVTPVDVGPVIFWMAATMHGLAGKIVALDWNAQAAGGKTDDH
jgi:hypothetical protein